MIALAVAVSSSLVRALVNWTAGPETERSKKLATEIDVKRAAVKSLQRGIEELEEERLKVRRAAKRAKPGWWSAHREELLVNVVAGLIVSVPLLAAGIIIGKLWP